MYESFWQFIWLKVQAFLHFVGLTEGPVIGGFIGAILSIKFNTDSLNWWQRTSTIFCGWMVASYVTPLCMDYFTLKNSYEYGVAFMLGLFGMALVGALFNAIQKADILSLLKIGTTRKDQEEKDR